jgi:hypothetical protein
MIGGLLTGLAKGSGIGRCTVDAVFVHSNISEAN